ncbi:MAG: hypothetical protein E6850_09410 [Leclercia adecarboxylata]|nr:hypothetical protein [Leclercia adecarboxylata]
MTTNKPMTGEQLDELMAVAVRMQRDAEIDRNFPSANFAYAVQVAVLELRRTRDIAAALAAENAALKHAMAVTLEHVSVMDTGQAGCAAMIINDALHHSEPPATDSFLAAVRASELDSLAGVAETMLVEFSNQQCSSDMHEVVGWKMVHQQASNRAAQLRQEASK